ncbi:MAG: hypothetical protein K0M50_20825 [Prolixibacteraceae bacterium]|nr:hypothetical protein [Prolixibacteraceae bacterium]
MKASDIPNHEGTFQSTGLDSDRKKFILTEGTFPIKGTAETIQIMDCALESGEKNLYLPEETAKKKIGLHFTMCFLK